MASFDTWDVVKVPFPYTDRPVRERRPALIISYPSLQNERGLAWVLMITSYENRGWAGDVAVSDVEAAGLPAASIVRTAKIATIEAKEAKRLGSLPKKDRTAIERRLAATLAHITLAGRKRG